MSKPKYTADVIMEAPNTNAMIMTTEKVVVVGASTGGTEALSVFLQMLPEDTRYRDCPAYAGKLYPPPLPSV